MGYTHYFPQRGEISTRRFKHIGEELKKLLDSRDSRVPPVAWEFDEPNEPAEIHDTLIRFNGIGEDGHETFYLPIKSKARGYESAPYEKYGFKFCKTARKPYDIVVCAALLIANHHARMWLEIGSDGYPADLDPDEYPNAWLPARELVEDVLGYIPEYPHGIKPGMEN